MTTGFEDHCWKDIATPEMLKVYSAYARDVHVGEKPALVLIDLYNCVFEGGPRVVTDLVDQFPSSCGEYAWTAIAPTLALISACRKAAIPVIHVTAETREQTDMSGTRPAQRRRRSASSDAFEIKEEFKPHPTDIIVYKRRASGFFGTLLASHLVRLGAGSVIIAGETTSGCVRSTAVDSYSHGYHTVVVEECCFDRSSLIHKVNLFDIHHKYADVTRLDDVLSAIGRGKVNRAA